MRLTVANACFEVLVDSLVSGFGMEVKLSSASPESKMKDIQLVEPKGRKSEGPLEP
jgi:hypothetical protein